MPRNWAWNESIQSLADITDGLFIWTSTAIMILFEEQLSQFSIFSILPDLTKNGKNLI